MTYNENLKKFTNLYPVSKTLRFELVPVGSDGKPISAEDATKLFAKIIEQDNKIKKAYNALKPLMDKIHEKVINISLTSDEAKKIDFSPYLELYKIKEHNKQEKLLREAIAKTYEVGIKYIKEKAGYDSKGNPVLKKESVKSLTESGMLKYLRNVINEISDESEKNELEAHLNTFVKFYTYFTGYNQNRENFYYYKDENSTAVATRIVHENLPKFCDNCIQFLDGKVQKKKKTFPDMRVEPISRKVEYLNAYQFLKDSNRTTQIKDAETNKLIEAYPINEKIFNIDYFSACLSQSGIEEYNRIIGHYNSLINLYNQAHSGEKDFKKLPPFKILYKQIGCGEKKSLFYALKFDTKEEQQKSNEESETPLNLEEMLQLISDAGKKYFDKSNNANQVKTIYDFIDYLKQTEDWDGIYWSKSAVDKISDQYFANWHDIKDRLKANKACVSYDKNREDPIRVNDAVELSGLFEVLNQEQSDGWSKTFFKNAIIEDRKSIIDEKLAPGKNTINLICADIEDFAKRFCNKSTEILKIDNYKNEENIFKIKEWLDTAKSLLWLIKYFDVKESKIKGSSINPELTNMLSALLRADDAQWLDWYDVVRNYLTKKPQDDAKKNKLKLNFENPVLLQGWSDGQEKSKGSVLINHNNKYYVGVLIERAIFDTSKKNNPIYIAEDKSTGRLILKTLALKTLAGKGFVRDFGEKYSDMGKRNPQEAINQLQLFIKTHYVDKYPLLKEVSEIAFSDKKLFDKNVQEVLTECYECDFAAINWNLLLQYIDEERLYLFEIYSKDFSEKSKGNKPNLQTEYWEHIFKDKSNIQLCGGGEIFFREKVITDDKKVVHYANRPIKRRSDGKIESQFSHDIIKDKRFTMDKYFFHIPIKINYQASSMPKINDEVNKHFTHINDIQFLGIDRGEKHLIYYSLIDIKGNIIEQNHFDVINKKDYLQEINEAVKKRRENRQNWQEIGNIKNLKDGYISLVVHEIIEKLKDNNGNFKPTFIVMEDLNTGFKRSRQKFEQQVYQKFELALAKKLNYLVDKGSKLEEIGSVAKGLQLTPPVANFKDVENRKQVGIMLYTRANYTSVTDPETGWRKTKYLKKGSEAEIRNQICKTFSHIGLDNNGDYYFQYSDENNGKTWILWSGKNGKSLERYRFRRGKNKNEGVIEAFNIKEMLDNLFLKYDKSKLLSEQFSDVCLSKIDDKNTPWESLRFIIDVIQQIRNSGDSAKGQDDNFLLSPVRNEKGEHFDSRIYQNQVCPKSPKDADANGAFNIGRKGLIMFEHIKYWQSLDETGKQKSKLNLFVSDKEWDLWLYDRKKWEYHLDSFALRSERESK